MPTLNNTKNQTSSKDNWSDNLLIKDKGGKLHHLNSSNKDKNVGSFSKKSTEIDHNLSLAPADDSFSANQLIDGTAETRADLVFHPEDDQQLKKIAKNIPLDGSKKYSIDKIAERIIEKQGLKFDTGNKKLFIDILFDFFRNRKKASGVREILSSKIKSAKKSLALEVVDNIVSVIKGIKAKVDSQSGLVVRMSEIEKPPVKIQPEITQKILPEIGPPKVVYDLDEEADTSDIQELAKFVGDIPKEKFEIPDKKAPIVKDLESDLKETLEIEKELPKDIEQAPKKEEEEKPQPIPVKIVEPPKQEPKEDVVLAKVADDKKEPGGGFEIPDKKAPIVKGSGQIKDQPKPIKSSATHAKGLEQIKKEPVTASLPKVVRPMQDAKNQISDVKTQPKPAPMAPRAVPKHALSGPVQELQVLDLHNWRNLGDDADSRAERLMEKINMLEEESFTKKAQGIDAWRKSPVHQEYLELGAESMGQGKEVSTLITEYEQQGKETLSIEEFAAVSDLNKKLRF